MAEQNHIFPPVISELGIESGLTAHLLWVDCRPDCDKVILIGTFTVTMDRYRGQTFPEIRHLCADTSLLLGTTVSE